MSDSTAAVVLHPMTHAAGGDGIGRDALGMLAEAVGLAEAISLDVVQAEAIHIRERRPSTLFGSGKVEEWAARLEDLGHPLVVVNASLSPIQQRNLERAWKCKVIDRTGLILEIFGERAQTKEGRLQVELAQLEYQKSRLVRSWTHLERQRGGLGKTGGPGESQIELDRRIIRDRIAWLKGKLEKVQRTRELHRKTRRETPYPVVALVGYTNAGKSTLFNRLTGAKVMEADMLFATLDPTMRAIELPSGLRIILSDTVGFVSNLPTQLVAAFRATLEEVLEAQLLLHVRDISHPETEAQKQDVEKVLHELGLGDDLHEHMIEVHNKIDLLEGEAREKVELVAESRKDAAAVSAEKGIGLEALCELIDRKLRSFDEILELDLPASDGRRLAWLHSHGDVLKQEGEGEILHLQVRLSAANKARFLKEYTAA